MENMKRLKLLLLFVVGSMGSGWGMNQDDQSERLQKLKRSRFNRTQEINAQKKTLCARNEERELLSYYFYDCKVGQLKDIIEKEKEIARITEEIMPREEELIKIKVEIDKIETQIIKTKLDELITQIEAINNNKATLTQATPILFEEEKNNNAPPSQNNSTNSTNANGIVPTKEPEALAQKDDEPEPPTTLPTHPKSTFASNPGKCIASALIAAELAAYLTHYRSKLQTITDEERESSNKFMLFLREHSDLAMVVLSALEFCIGALIDNNLNHEV